MDDDGLLDDHGSGNQDVKETDTDLSDRQDLLTSALSASLSMINATQRALEANQRAVEHLNLAVAKLSSSGSINKLETPWERNYCILKLLPIILPLYM